MSSEFSILFVCLGNICRSPLGEGILRNLVQQKNLTQRYRIDSCGTGGWHVGSKPHRDSIRIAKQNGIDISSQRARQLCAEDFKEFNLLVAMDQSNRNDILSICGGQPARIVCLREYDSPLDNLDVPDPYFGGWDGFVEVFEIVSRCCNNLLDSLERK